MTKQLHAPWRDKYAQQDSAEKKKTDLQSCPFCTELAENNDPHYFILRRFKHCFIVLNRYPYNAGHVLILPLVHGATLDQLNKETRAELIELLSATSQLLTTVLQAQGINMGINLGSAAGAGIPAHLHLHVLPRWTGDTNFMPTLGAAKVISFDLTTIYKTLKSHIDQIVLL